MNYLHVKLYKRDFDKANEFAKKRSKDVAVYKARGSFKLSDITTGALAEIACHRALHDCGIEVCKPDFNIYDASQKSFASDLNDGRRHFHIKGQTLQSAETYGASWLMQKWDPLMNNPEFGHYIMPCVVDHVGKAVQVYGCIPARTIVNEGLIDECAVPSFRRTKIALYLSTLTTGLTTNRKWSIMYEAMRRL